MKKIFLLCVLVICFDSFSLGSFMQSDLTSNSSKKDLIYKNRRGKYPVGINLMAFGPAGSIGMSIDWFIKPKFNVEFGAGLLDIQILNPSYFAGVKYHVFGNTVLNTTPYLGFFDKVEINSNILSHQFYIPIGLQRINRKKLTWSIEAAYVYDLNTENSFIWGAFKLGYRFNRRQNKSIINLG